MSTLALPGEEELYAENMSVADLLALETVYTARGFNLVNKGFLLGFPFLITGVRFQPIDIPTTGPNKGVKPRGYVTLECAAYSDTEVKFAVNAQRIAHYDTEEKKELPRPASMEDLKVAPEERFVINDGSTGIRRQIVWLLNRAGYVDVCGEKVMDPNDPRLDLPWDEWSSVGNQTVNMRDKKDNELNVPYISRNNRKDEPFVIAAPRGLRVSDYDVEGSGKAATFYVG